MPNRKQSDKTLLTVLLILCLIPVLSGVYRLYSISANGAGDPENLHYLTNPAPIAVHMLSYMAFCVFGTFQIAPGFRARHPKWHKIAGRLLIPTGLIAAATGIWMTLNYPPLISNGETVGMIRIAFGAAMILSLILGIIAIRRRNIETHKRWMLRAYAIAMGASTQALVAIPWFVIIGEPQGLPWALAMTLAWLFNLSVAERYARTNQAFTSTKTRPLT